MTQKKTESSPKCLKLQIASKDGTKSIAGKFYPEKKLFMCTRKKSEDYVEKYKSWGLDANIVKYLATNKAVIELKDSQTKWTYKCNASDFLLHGTLVTSKLERDQYYLPTSHWTVEKASGKSFILKCHNSRCRHNFFNNCLRGTVEINTSGACDHFETN